MTKYVKPIEILMADDDPEDRLLVLDAWEESRLANNLSFVEDGEELMDYLYHRGKYETLTNKHHPDLILLDLNMPRKDGREALKEIKADPKLKRIPVIVLTTSKEEADILKTYDLGANSFIKKPVTFESLVEVVRAIAKYWFQIVELIPESKDL
jgi:CheY-like chemotaxis protein